MRKFLNLLCATLVVCAAILVYPEVAAGAADGVYEPARLEFGVLNKAILNDTDAYNAFYNQYVLANSPFNQIGYFKDAHGQSYLYGGQYIRPNYYLSMKMGWPETDGSKVLPIIDALRMKGDLQMMMRGTFHTVMHYGDNHKKTEALAYTGMRLIQGANGENVIAARASTAKLTQAVAVGDHAWFKPAAPTPGITGTMFRLQVLTYSTLPNDSCGDARVSNMAIAFADTVAPKLTNVYTSSDPAGKVKDTTFKADETLYVNLVFDENVRLSDDNKDGAHIGENAVPVPLDLDIYNRNGVQVTGSQDGVAYLYKVSGNTVTFKYTVPETLTTGGTATPTDHYIGGINKNQGALLGGSQSFGLTILGAVGRIVTPPGSYAALTKTSSLITDLAGNPVSSLEWGFVEDAQRCKIDAVSPTIESVEVARDPGGPIDVGPGAKLTFTARFSEPLEVSSLSGAKAAVNIKVGSGDTAPYVSANVESLSPDKKTITLAPITISSEMKPEPVGDDEDAVYYACLTSITFPGGAKDLCGNTYDGSVGVSSTNQIYIDTLPPTVDDTILDPDGDGVCTPSGSTASFYLPFKIFDSAAHGPQYTSGITTKGNWPGPKGEFAWVNNETGGDRYSFQWAVTASIDEPAESKWLFGVMRKSDDGDDTGRYSFDQIPKSASDDPQFLHIRLIDSVLYNISDSSIVFYPEDFVGNEGKEVFRLNYIADEVGPAYVASGYTTSYDSGTGKGSITARVRLIDPSKVRPDTVYYMWLSRGEPSPSVPAASDPGVEGWTPYGGGGEPAASLTLDIRSEELGSGSGPENNHKYDLYLTSKDLAGHASVSQALQYDLDLTYPGYSISDISEGLSTDPVFKITPPSSHPDTGAPATMIVMIKDPLDMNGDKYFVRTLNSEGWDLSDDDLLAVLSWTDPNVYTEASALGKALGAWRYVKLIEDGEFTLHLPSGEGSTVDVLYGFSNAEGGTGVAYSLYDLCKDNNFDHDEDNPRIAAAQRLMAIMDGKYYGDIQITVISGYGATCPGTSGDEVESGIYNVNAAGQGNFVNEAAYYWSNPADEKEIGYYYDLVHEHPVSPLPPKGQAPKLDTRPETGYFVSYIPEGAIVNAQTWILSAAANEVGLVQNPADTLVDCQPDGYNLGHDMVTYNLAEEFRVNDATVTPVNIDDLKGVEGWSSPAQGSRFVTSLDGEEVTVTLDNSIVDDWDLADIDFTSADTYLALELVSSPDTTDKMVEVYRTSLEPLSIQKITLPGGAAPYSGHYRLVVSAKAKASGIAEKAIYNDIYVDRSGIGEFGLAKVESAIASDVFDKTNTSWYGFDADGKDDAKYQHPALRLGNAVSGPVGVDIHGSLTHRLFFTAKSAGKEITDGDGTTSYGDLFVKVWNASEGLSEERVAAGKAAAKWAPLSTKCLTGITAVFLGSLDAITDSTYGSEGAPTIPLALPEAGQDNLRNVLQYQVVSSNGKSSDVMTLLVTVGDKAPQFSVELNPDKGPLVSYTTATVTELTGNTFDNLCAYHYIGAHSSGTHTPIGGETIQTIKLAESGTHWFYATDAYGNYTFVKKDVDFVDGTPPEISDVRLTNWSDDRFELKYMISDNYTPDDVIPEGFSLYLRFSPTGPDNPYHAGYPEFPNSSATTYHELLGYEKDEFVEIKLPDYTSADTQKRIAVAKEPSGLGIYEVTASRVGSELLVTLSGVLKREGFTYGEWHTHGVQVYVEDTVGNRSDVLNDVARMHNTKPDLKYYNRPDKKSVSYDRGPGSNSHAKVTAEFSIPVILERPQSREEDSTFSTVKDQLLIYGDEDNFAFRFIDIFGEEDTVYSDIDCIGDDSLKVSFSTTEPTTGPVIVDIEVADTASGLTFTAWLDEWGGERIATRATAASTEIYENTTIWCNIWPFAADGRNRVVTIPIRNIFNALPVAGVTWYYDEFVSNGLPSDSEGHPTVTTTFGEVTAYLTSLDDRRLHAINGTSESHTFTYGDQAGSTYTFEFADAAGNTGSLTVTLQVTIDTPPPVPDMDPPEYHLNVYGTYDGSQYLMGSYSTIKPLPDNAPKFSDVLEDVSWTSGYQLHFDMIVNRGPDPDAPQDPNKYVLVQSAAKIIVLDGEVTDTSGLTFDDSVSEPIEGVSVSGKTVAIDGSAIPRKADDSGEPDTGNLVFTIAIIDQSNRVTMAVVSGGWLKLDIVGPSIDVDYVKTGFYQTTAYINLTDDKSGSPVLISPVNMSKLPADDPEHPGQAYKTFDEDGGFQVVAEDAAMNRTTEIVQVSGIDTSAPKVTVQWYPYFIEENGTPDYQRPSGDPTNKNVRVDLGFDRTIEEMTVTIQDVDKTEVGDYVKTELLGDRAVITFLKNASGVTVSYTGQNEKTGTTVLDPVTVIDRDPPTIATGTSPDTPSNKSVTVVFTLPLEPIWTEDGMRHDPLSSTEHKTITKVIGVRGSFSYNFFDEAGNVTTVEVKVENIDEAPPVIMVMGEGTTDGSYKKAPHTFYATMNEKGIITFQGVPYEVYPDSVGPPDPTKKDPKDKLNLDDIKVDIEAGNVQLGTYECHWIPLSVTQNGTYQIEAVDEAGRKTFTYVTVDCLDNTPPAIAFSSPTTISVREGTSFDDFRALVEPMKDVTVSDNVTLPEQIMLDIELSPFNVQDPLTAPLKNPRLYTLDYTATDQAGNSRTVSRNVRVYPADELVVSINNVKTEPTGTTVFSGTTSFVVIIENLEAGTEPVKLYLRSGRWTAGQMKSVVPETPAQFPIELQIDGKGYYTLYIVSQSRQAYLTYLYIQ